MSRMLVAGVGNIFLSDDGFGVEVVRQIGRPATAGGRGDRRLRHPRRAPGLPAARRLRRARARRRRAARRSRRAPSRCSRSTRAELADAAAGRASGASAAGRRARDGAGADPRACSARSAGRWRRVLVVACEPESVEEGLGLSAVVQAAVPRAIELVEQVMQTEQRMAEGGEYVDDRAAGQGGGSGRRSSPPSCSHLPRHQALPRDPADVTGRLTAPGSPGESNVR